MFTSDTQSALKKARTIPSKMTAGEVRLLEQEIQRLTELPESERKIPSNMISQASLSMVAASVVIAFGAFNVVQLGLIWGFFEFLGGLPYPIKFTILGGGLIIALITMVDTLRATTRVVDVPPRTLALFFVSLALNQVVVTSALVLLVPVNGTG